MSARSDALRAVFERLFTYKVLNWHSGSSATDDAGDTKDRVLAITENSDVVTSKRVADNRHMVVLDIDHPAWLIKSSTPDHYHLYIDVPGGVPWEEYTELLRTAANAGVIEHGFANASIARGFTSVRLPWVRKPVSGNAP